MEALHMRKKNIYKCCGRIGHNSYACITCGPKFIPSSLIRNMNKFNALRVDEAIDPTIEWNRQTPPDHFKYRKSPTKTSPVVSAITTELIIIPLIMVVLRFTLHVLHLNLPLNLFQIRTPHQSNQVMIMKCTISWNYSTQDMMMLFWMLTSR